MTKRWHKLERQAGIMAGNRLKFSLRHVRKQSSTNRLPQILRDRFTALSLRRKIPCHDHPLDRGKSDHALAGLLACGSTRDAKPSQTSHELASGPVAVPCRYGGHPMQRARRLQLQGQPGIERAVRPVVTHVPYYALVGHQRVWWIRDKLPSDPTRNQSKVTYQAIISNIDLSIGSAKRGPECLHAHVVIKIA